MKDQLQKLIKQVPFAAFAIDVAEDVAYAIPTSDHVLLGKEGVVIMGDDGLFNYIPYTHIRRLTYSETAHS